MKKEKILPLTSLIRQNLEIVFALDDNIAKVLNQSFWQKKVNMSSKIEYLQAVGMAKGNLWSAIAKEYPEVKQTNAWANRDGIFYTEEIMDESEAK